MSVLFGGEADVVVRDPSTQREVHPGSHRDGVLEVELDREPGLTAPDSVRQSSTDSEVRHQRAIGAKMTQIIKNEELPAVMFL